MFQLTVAGEILPGKPAQYSRYRIKRGLPKINQKWKAEHGITVQYMRDARWARPIHSAPGLQSGSDMAFLFSFEPCVLHCTTPTYHEFQPSSLVPGTLSTNCQLVYSNQQ